MKKSTFLSLILLCSSTSHSIYAKEVNIDEDAKISKYHQVLMKRPESTVLFEKFYSNWLSKHSEESLEIFLKQRTAKGATADMQIYAYLMMQRGRDLEALKVLNSAVDLDAKNAQVFLDRAKVYSQLLDFEKAITDVDAALKLGSDNELFLLKANKLKGRYLTRQGLADEAIAHWGDLAKKNPDDQELIEDVIDILMGDGLYQAALEHAEKLKNSTRDPYKKALRTLRVADILQKKGDRDKALLTYKENLNLAGADSWLERELIAQIENLFRKEENLEGLRLELEGFSKKYPQRTQITQKLANFYSETNEHKKAQELYLDIIKRSPDNTELKNGLLQALEKAGNYDASRDLLISMIQLLPKDAELEIKLAEVYNKLKNKEKALEHLRLFSTKIEQNAGNALRYANIIRSLAYKDEAVTAFEQAIKTYPDNDEVKFSAAEYFVLIDKKKSASVLWNQLANSKNVETIIKLIDVLLFNSEKETAFKLVVANEQEFKTKKSFINSAINVAKANKDNAAMIRLSKISLQLADSPTEIDSSILKFSKVIEQLDMISVTLKELKAKKKLTNKDQFLLVSLLGINGEQEESEKILQQLAKGEDIAALLISVRVYERRYELDEAAKTMERILTLPEGLKATYLKQLSRIYEDYENLEDALDATQRWKKLTPNDKAAWLTEVELLEASGKSIEALEALRRGVERFEEEEEVQAKLAALYFDNSNFAQASRIYWKLYDNSKDLEDRIRWVSELARTASAHNTTNQLIDTLSERRRTSPKAVAPLMALAEVYRSEKRYKERRTLLMEATRLRPEDSAILIEVAKSDLTQGQRDSAIKLLKSAQKVDKKGVATKRLAQLYFKNNDYKQGMAELEKLTSGKLDARVIEGLVLDLLKQQAFEEAKDYLTQHLGKFPKDGRLRLLASIIDYEVGFVEQSFNSSIELLNSELEMNGVKTGWKVDDLINRGQGFTQDKNLSELVKASTVAPFVYTKLQALSISNSYQQYSGGLGAGNSLLPGDKESLILITRLHACKMLNDVSGELRSQWEAKLKNSGVKDTELWNSFSDLKDYENTAAIKLYLKNLADPAYLELATHYYLNRFELKVPKELYVKMQEQANNLSEEKQNMLKYFVPAGTSIEDHKAKIIKTLLANEEVDATGLMAYIRLDNQLMFQVTTEHKDSSEWTALISKFLDQNKELADSKFNPYQQGAKAKKFSLKARLYPWINNIYKGLLLKGEDYKKIAELIENDVKGANNYNLWVNQPKKKNLLSPYEDLTSVNSYQVNLVVKKENDNRGGQVNLDYEKLAKESVIFKNIILKYLVAQSANSTDEHNSILEEALKNDTYKADALLLKAAAAFKKNEDVNTVVSYLKEAKSASTNKLQRQALDNYLIETIMSKKEGYSMKNIKAEHQETLKSAGRRLLLGRKIIKANEIESLLTNLDMLDEKHRYLTKSKKSIRTAASPSGGILGNSIQSASGFRSSNQNSSINSWDKAKELLAKDQKENAVRLLANDYVKKLKSSNRKYETRQISNVVKQNKLELDVLALMHPADNMSPRKWINYFHAAKSFGNKIEQEKALKYLKKLTITPQSLRLPMAIAINETEPSKALELLNGCFDKTLVLSQLSEALNVKFNDARSSSYNIRATKAIETKDIDSYMSVLRMVTHYIESLENSFVITNQSSFSNLISNMSSPIKGINERDRKEHAKVLDKYDSEIEELVVKLTTKILLSKTTSEKAFEILHASYKEKNKLKDLEKILIISLQTMAAESESVLPNNSSNYSYNSGYDNSNYPVTRLVFLGEMILREKSSDVLDSKMLDELEKIHPDFATKLKFLKTNILSNDEVISKQLEALNSKSSITDVMAWDELLSLRGNRTHDALLLTAILEATAQHFSNSKLSSYDYKTSQLIQSITPLIVRSVGIDKKTDNEIEIYLNELAGEFVGKLDNEERLKKWVDIVNENNRNNSAKFRLFSQITDAMVKKPESSSLAVKIMNDVNYPYSVLSRQLRYNNNYIPIDVKDWIKALEANGLLVKPAEVKVETFLQHDDFEISELGKSYPNLYYVQNYKREKAIKSNWEALTEGIDNNYTKEGNKLKKNIINKLSEIKDDRMLSAQVSLVLINSLSLQQFCEKNKEAINASPDSFKRVLIDIFDLNYDLKKNAIFSNYGINLPFDKDKLKEKASSEIDDYLKMKAPLSNNYLYQIQEQTKKLVAATIITDIDKACEITDHYIYLIKNSPEATQLFTPRDRYLSSLQSALVGGLFSSLKYEKIHAGDLLPLIYHLSKREDYLSLNIYGMITDTISSSWLKDVNSNTKIAKSEIFKKHADIYANIKDSTYAEFYKTAWFIYLNSNRTSFVRNTKLEDIINLKSGEESKDEFLDWLAGSMKFHRDWISYGTYLSAFKPYKEVAMFRIRKKLRDDIEPVVELASGYSYKNRVYMASALYDRGSEHGVNYDMVSKSIISFIFNAMNDAMEADKNYGISADMRHAFQIRSHLNAVSDEQLKTISISCAKSFKLGIESIRKGEFLHTNHLGNICGIAGLTAEGAMILDETVRSYPVNVVGIVPLAQSLLKHGYIDSVVKVLPENKLVDIKNDYFRMMHHKGFDQYLDTLLERYNKPINKAHVAMLMTLPDYRIIKAEGTTSYHERVGKVLKLAHQAKADLSGSAQIDRIVSTFIGDCSTKDLHLFDNYYIKNKDKYNAEYYYNKAVANDFKYSSEQKYMFAAVRHAVHRDDQVFLRNFITKGSEMIKKNDFKNYDEMEYFRGVIYYIVSSIEQIYIEGGREQFVTKLLPLYREVMTLTAPVNGEILKSNGKRFFIQDHYKYLMKYIHIDLGKKKDFDKFHKKYSGQKSNNIFFRKKSSPLTFDIMRYVESSKIYKRYKISLPLDTKKSTLFLVNHPTFQKDVVTSQYIGGVFDSAVDQKIYENHHVIDLINSGEIKIKEPSFAGVLESDLAHVAALDQRYDDMLEHFNKMNEIFKISPTPKPGFMIRMNLRAITYLDSIGKTEIALSFMPKDLPAKMNKTQKKAYAKLISSLNKKKKAK